MQTHQKIIIATILRESGETGVQTYFNMLRNYLQEKKADVSLLTPFSFYKWLVLPVFGARKLIDKLSGELSVWWYRYWHYLFLKKVLKKQLAEPAEKNVPVVVYAQCPLSAKAALEARVTDNQKVVMVVHFNVSQADEWAEKGKIKKESWVYNGIKTLENEVIPSVDGIVYVSQFMKKAVEKNIPESLRVRSAVLANFVNKPKRLTSPKVEGELINVGTLEPRKNQRYLLYVLAEAKKKGKNYSLTLIGDGPERKNLEGLAESLDITNQVKFMGYQENAAQLLYSHRVYVHSASIDSLPISLIEALACNLPILAGAVGGIPEIFSDGVEGFYWPLDAPAIGAEKLIALMEDPETYNKMVAAAERRYTNNFQTSIVGDRVREFLLSALSNER